jgi:hypothetical protein
MQGKLALMTSLFGAATAQLRNCGRGKDGTTAGAADDGFDCEVCACLPKSIAQFKARFEAQGNTWTVDFCNQICDSAQNKDNDNPDQCTFDCTARGRDRASSLQGEMRFKLAIVTSLCDAHSLWMNGDHSGAYSRQSCLRGRLHVGLRNAARDTVEYAAAKAT